MKPAPSKTELSPSTQLRKVVFGGSLKIIYGDPEKNFDAVLASRRWKENVARKTADMNAGQVLAFFNRDQALSRMQSCRKRTTSRVATR